jgi:hypothetical protein
VAVEAHFRKDDPRGWCTRAHGQSLALSGSG